jgi:ssRNA-specific RNase YbeY (16S rRNA maturation enzyme)
VVEEGTKSSSAKGLGPWLARIAPRSARGTINVAILPDRKVRALNRQFRRKDKPTDVLSFAETGSFAEMGSGGFFQNTETGSGGFLEIRQKTHPTPFLGDIAI